MCTDLKGVVTVKLEVILCPSDTSIIYDLAGLGFAFRDFEQAVRGRNKLEVTCMDTCMNNQHCTSH